jgi:hypothetical protein
LLIGSDRFHSLATEGREIPPFGLKMGKIAIRSKETGNVRIRRDSTAKPVYSIRLMTMRRAAMLVYAIVVISLGWWPWNVLLLALLFQRR